MAITSRASFLLSDETPGLTSSISGTIPASAQAGDVALLAVVQATGVNTFTDPAGWTRLRSVEDRINSNLSTLLWARKLVAADAGAAVTVTASGGARFVGVGHVFAGANTVAELTVTEGEATTATTSLSSPNLTTTTADSLIVNVWAVRSNTLTPPSVTAPSSHTADGESNTANPVAPNLAVRISHRTAIATTVGSYGGAAAAVSQTSTAILYSVALTPSASTVTVDAGGGQTDVEPGSTVTLTGTSTGGTITARSWTQTAGTSVTLTGTGATRTFTAPATLTGVTLTFRYSVTNSDGAVFTDTVSVVVLSSAERAVVGGAWVALRLSELVGPSVVNPPPEDPPVDPDPQPDPGPPVVASPSREWTMWSRTPGYTLDEALPIISAQILLKHLGVSNAVCRTTYTAARWASLQPAAGVVLYRGARQEFSGLVTARQLDWDAENGRAVILVEAKSDAVLLEDRLVFPDPLRAADDQTVSDYWTFTGAASSAMLRLISDQAGPTCRASRRVPGLTLGTDPGAGSSRTWSALFDSDGSALGALAAISVTSGANLGLRITSEPGGLTAEVYRPRDLAQAVRFSVELSNLVEFTYREEAPTVTDAVAAGQGDLKARTRRYVATTSSSVLSWGRRIWSYVDRRDTTDTAELLQAARDAVTEGESTVSATVALVDSDAATYGLDWGLGDQVTVHIGVPEGPGSEWATPSDAAGFGTQPFATSPFGGQAGTTGGETWPMATTTASATATVTDVVREIKFEITENGAEDIRPVVGTWDAKALIQTPLQRQVANIGAQLANLMRK